MTIRSTISYGNYQADLPVYHISFLLDEIDTQGVITTNSVAIGTSHIQLSLIEFTVDGFSYGVGGLYYDAIENYVVVPSKFIINESFKTAFKEICSSDPKNCTVDSFHFSNQFGI